MMFFGLSSLILWEYKKRHARENLRQLLLIAFAAPLAFGALIEVLQGALTDYRSADLFDFFHLVRDVDDAFALFFQIADDVEKFSF